MLNLQNPDVPLLGLGASPQLGRPEKLCMLPVERDAAGCWRYAELMRRLELGPEQILFSLDGRDTDWFSHPLPDWARRAEVQHLLLLPLYPQPPFMNQTLFDTADGLAAQRLWSGRAPPPGEELASTAMADAIEQAVNQINREGPASPPGLVRVPPAPTKNGLRLALGSCGYPPGILNEHPPSRGWDLLNDRLDGTQPPQWLVLTGDQIYADATAGLFDPTLADDRYRKPYETWLHGKSVRRALGRVPLVCLPDDHELEDNWEPLAPDAPADAAQRNRDVHERGLRYFLRYQRLRFTATAEETLAEPLWHAFEAEGIPVFLLDTRSRRQGRHGDTGFGAAGLLGAEQWQALRRWLLEGPRDRPRLIVSPAIFLPRHRYALPARLAFGREDASIRACRRSDGWDGHPETLLSLLELIGEHQLRGLVFLSGDEHLGVFTTARLRRPGSKQEIAVHSIHTAGLNTPYRFANADAAELVQDEVLSFEGVSGSWECVIGSRVFGGAGFTQLSLQPQTSGSWQLHCEFSTCEPCAQPPDREVLETLDLF
ncbi:alkaline phosphatase D family protein [Solimonas sp. SE-A11]|uniref:alkaline phosphatase D family protein n=1 Tax=Solimonas sp. SE-A11 TaxID=3054954 RepID=UPI00259CBDD3|nr:alkaline phosphatase D family protein [Solimonas sp. SE-A11]MDM4770192.1 alkaline phosphatase D family protein [Solimonas sp. SE-A11]